MAYTDSTLNYQIPLPQANDTFNPLDWNESAEKIDTAIHNASQIADTARDDLVKVKKEVVDLQTGLGETDDRATALTARVGVLEQNDNTYAEGIEDLGDMFTAREVKQAQSDVEIGVGKWFRYNGVLYVCTVEIKVGDTIVPNVNCRATNVESEMPSGSGGLVDRIETLEAENTLMKNKLNSIEPNVTSLETTMGNTSIAGIGEGTVTSALADLDNSVEGNLNDIASLLARVTALEKGGGMSLDYSKYLNLNTGASISTNGVIFAHPTNWQSGSVSIGNAVIASTANGAVSQNNNGSVGGSISAPVRIGDIVTFTGYGVTFVPYAE